MTAGIPSGRHRADRATAEILAAAGRVAALVHDFPGDEFSETRSQLLACAAWLEDLADVVPVQDSHIGRRVVGENIRHGIDRMASNRGWSAR